MSEIKVNKISPKQTCTQLTLGDSGDTIIIPAGATIQNSGTATGFGRTGTVDWDTTVKTTTVTAVSGVGYFVNTTSGAITVNLPAGVAGSIVAISDYANTAATNKITIAPNGTDKINGINLNSEIATNGVAVTLIYVDSTRGWKDVNDATLDITGINPFVVATGGTITTSGDYKTHTFTGPGTFTVTSAGSPAGSNSVEYLVVAGGAGGGGSAGSGGAGGGGAGGFRQNFPSPAFAGLPLTVQAYPITVGAGGPGGIGVPGVGTRGSNGNPSIFSTITSTGGGGGGNNPGTDPSGFSGGSGGGSGYGPSTGGAGNTPPVSPPQGNPGGSVPGQSRGSAGGGGAGAPGGNGPGSSGYPTGSDPGGPGGAGLANSISGSSVTYAGGGGGSVYAGTPGSGGPGGGGAGGNSPGGTGVSGTANTGGGGGSSGANAPGNGGSGGSGIVIIRYKFQ